MLNNYLKAKLMVNFWKESFNLVNFPSYDFQIKYIMCGDIPTNSF